MAAPPVELHAHAAALRPSPALLPPPAPQEHHAGASCPDLPAPCDWAQLSSPLPNPQLLKGALVGGPTGPGDLETYVDARDNYETNEARCCCACCGVLHAGAAGRRRRGAAAAISTTALAHAGDH